MDILALLVVVALGLTMAMFMTSKPHLGWPAAIFWGLSGGQSYQMSTAAFDIFSLLGFACLAGMFVFVPLSALGFKDNKDEDSVDLMNDKTLRDDEREDRRIERSEAAAERAELGDGMSDMDRPRESAATQRVRQRASNRRNNGRSKIRW